ncbi:hypothetical protein LCGC14_1887100 [marine sediment metagenome]|uniref:Uncharacterized protein n=1 Tax=marine sediment metagenome TaxID=412755 RepID=A0A0F9G0I1_9ZZZZ
MVSWLLKLMWRIVSRDIEFHYDYCAVFAGFPMDELTASGWPCSEDCANHPGSKVLLNRRTGDTLSP